MSALKEFLADKVGISILSTSPLWDQDVSTITPSQMVAFVAKMKGVNRRDEAESALEIAMQTVLQAAHRGVVALPLKMLDYQRSFFTVLTSGELRRGLAFMQPAQAYAVVFALEMKMTGHEVARLTHKALADLRRSRQLSPLADACLERMPRNVISPYVFWRVITSDDDARIRTAPVPIMDLDEAVFDAFGLVWGELAEVYERLIHVDEDADRLSFETFFGR